MPLGRNSKGTRSLQVVTGGTEGTKTQTGRTVSWEAGESLEVSTAFPGTGDAEVDLGQRRKTLQLYLEMPHG